MTLIAKDVKIVSCKQAPDLVGEVWKVISETKHTFVLRKNNSTNLNVDKKIRLQKTGLEIMVAM